MKQWWSVMLLYPDYVSDGTETYYDFVQAKTRAGAVRAAVRQCMKSNEWTKDDINDPTDFAELLVLKGRHRGV